MSVCFHGLLQEGDMPEEVNLDDLIDLPNDEERVQMLQVNRLITEMKRVFVQNRTRDHNEGRDTDILQEVTWI